MLVVLSPAKSLDYESPVTAKSSTKPQFVNQAAELVDILRPMSPVQLAGLMSISDKLAVLNATRYGDWSTTFTKANSRQAVLAFDGDVYDGLQARTLDEEGLKFAQKHLRILSGLYGILRPLDLMQPYRLEMGTKLPNPAGKDLYAYWKSTVAPALNKELGPQGVLVNLASDEYFKSVDLNALNARVVQPVFQDEKNGQYKVISFFAKKARGLMARYIIDQRITDVEQLKQFKVDGYRFDAKASSADVWVFRRKESA
ncbi:MAG: peroxide stress protein YaaA [Limnobacter sp.]|uniref:peroxide stress protein YaaA n=1 Tax=Limnobacter sp. TaxID=2003368 RepID=UPI00391CDCC5